MADPTPEELAIAAAAAALATLEASGVFVTAQDVVDILTSRKNDPTGNSEVFVVVSGVDRRRITRIEHVTEADTNKLLIYVEE